ncbi:MAG: hypothetical protein SOW50_04995 [Lachnospiraceae bacterium]|nr:hypothetical protein [Lachnospiraceae bacterium]
MSIKQDQASAKMAEECQKHESRTPDRHRTADSKDLGGTYEI